jgi:hypothetical protein
MAITNILMREPALPKMFGRLQQLLMETTICPWLAL